MIIKNDQFDDELVQNFFPEAYCFKPMKIANFPNTRGITLEDLATSDDYYATEKIDGSWYALNITENYKYLFGRTISRKNGLPVEKGANVPHILEAFKDFPKNTIIIGEIYTGDRTQTSKDTVSIMGSLPKRAIKLQEERGKLHFYIHDMILLNGKDLTEEKAIDRYLALSKLYKTYHLDKYDFIELAQIIETNNALEAAAEIIARGGEGVVLKKKDYPYEYNKRPAYSSVKIKKADTVDVVCMGFEDPTKEYNGKETSDYLMNIKTGEKIIRGKHSELNLLEDAMNNVEDFIEITKPFYYGWKTAIKIGLYKDGELVSIGTVSSGLTDFYREDFAKNPQKYIGQVIECECMELKDGSLRHPIFKRFREDKNAEECKYEEIFK
jgi:ATP-dependent DNA ligase